MELKDLDPFLEKIVKIDRTDDVPLDSRESYIGGYPFVPNTGQNWEWPRNEEGNPLVFIVQINFKGVPKELGYPAAGLLQIFVDLENFESSAEGEGLRAVFYNEEELNLNSISQPSDVGPTVEDEAWQPFWEEYSPRKIEFRESIQIPAPLYLGATWSNEGEGLEGKEKELYDLLKKTDGKLSEDLAYLTEHHHQLGGDPLWIQHPMLETHEIPTFMLQINSDDDFLSFGDDGNLHIFGDLEKLREGDVSEFFWEWACY